MDWRGSLEDAADLAGVHAVPAHPTSGHAIGIIAIDLVYPKLPGNVVNATTFDFPVLYRIVSFEIERLFAGDPAIEDQVVEAARELERSGVRAIVGACGFFAHFQESVAAAVRVPVFLSSLVQLPMIRAGLGAGRRVAVLAADGASVTDAMLSHVGASLDGVLVQDVGSLESFAPIRWGKTELDNGALTRDLAALAQRLVAENPDLGAILLECSDLPPYAAAIQRACGLPVFDFITLVNWVHQAVVQRPYGGWF